jgi:hypothetical protein
MALPNEAETAGGMDLVSGESDIENELESLTNEDVKLENDSKPEASEGAENDTVNTEASDYKSSKLVKWI